MYLIILPDEVPAVGTVCGLSQVRGHELVAIYLVDSAADGTLTFPGTHPLPKHTLFILGGACSSWKHRRFFFQTRLKRFLVIKMCSNAIWTLDGVDCL